MWMPWWPLTKALLGEIEKKKSTAPFVAFRNPFLNINTAGSVKIQVYGRRQTTIPGFSSDIPMQKFA
jgi:hypothetical protein